MEKCCLPDSDPAAIAAPAAHRRSRITKSPPIHRHACCKLEAQGNQARTIGNGSVVTDLSTYKEEYMAIEAINTRNQFRGKIKEIVSGPVLSEVDVETPSGIVTSVITSRHRDISAVG